MGAYDSRGVSAEKHDVHRALEAGGVGGGLFPGAFCRLVADPWTRSPEHCALLHADGAGTKSALAYLQYRATGDARVFEGIAWDALIMNLDDALCVGCTGPFLVSNTIGRNARLVPGEVIAAILRGYRSLAELLAPHGIELELCGGETADVGDLVRTLIVDCTIAARMRRAEVLDCSRVQPGHVIVGLASFGRASYESAENSGIGTNGFTAARHELLGPVYRERYPETYAPDIAELAYVGRCRLEDPLPGSALSLGAALLSPTRTYAPIVAPLLREQRGAISAIFHNTGGGLTKCLRFGGAVRYVKDDLFPPPPIFAFLRDAAKLPLRELVRVFNLGQRLEIVCEPQASAAVMARAADFGVQARVIGRVEPHRGGPELVIETAGETLEFRR